MAISLETIVVTGVAGETPRSQVPFTVERLDVAELQRVPTPSVRGLLQGKLPGVKVIQGSGQAGSEPSMQFRGPTSIMGMQAPLIVIDGVITQGGIADLNTQDIASMEVVKGAAAAALYGLPRPGRRAPDHHQVGCRDGGRTIRGHRSHHVRAE